MSNGIRKGYECLFNHATIEDEIEHKAAILSFAFMSEIEKNCDKKKITRSDLAVLLGTSKSYITQLYRGDKYVNVTLMAKAEKAFGAKFKIKLNRG